MKIKDLPRVERPREKIEKYGPERLSDSELLAILLRTGGRGVNVVELSDKILKKFGGKELSSATVEELKHTSGLGAAKASEIVACFELGRRFLHNKQSEPLLTPKDVWNELKDIRTSKKEHFVVFFLDARNQETKREIISIGSLNASLVHPREVFEPAIAANAAQIILAHNHPSNNSKPSTDDIQLTNKLIEAGKIIGIGIIDHVVVTIDDFTSFKEEGLL